MKDVEGTGFRSWYRRLAFALLLLAVCGFCFALPSICGEREGQDMPLVQASGFVDLSSDCGDSPRGAQGNAGGDATNAPFALFSALDGFSDYKVGFLPEGFEEEVLSPDDLGCSCVYSAAGVVGMVCEGASCEVRGRIVSLMEAHGWRMADDGGGSDGMTFVKSSGNYRWAYVLCSEVSGSVSVCIAYSTERG